MGWGGESNCILRFFFLTAPREKTENTRTRTDAHRTHTYIHTQNRHVGGWAGRMAGGQAGRRAGALLVHWAVVKGSLPSTPSLPPGGGGGDDGDSS